jgi:hypothetical protein
MQLEKEGRRARVGTDDHKRGEGRRNMWRWGQSEERDEEREVKGSREG